MARIRTIKPEFFTSADIVSLSPMARLLYIALWCEADKEGRLVWKPATFKLRYLPGDNCDVQALCDEVVKAGLVVLYGEGFAHIPAFKAHQHINPRESVSQLPDPDASTTRQPRVGTRQSRDSDAQGGREGKGRERVNDASPRFPEFWEMWPKSDRKGGKAECQKLWDDRGFEKQADSIIAHVKAMSASVGWKKDAGQFIPAPVVYLRAQKWDGAELSEPTATYAGAI